jgi:hypothetical protein
MSWWTSRDLHPKTKSRFVLVIGGYMIPTVKTITKPSVEVETKEYRMINHYYKYPGLVKWNPIKITFVDGVGSLLTIDPTTGRTGGAFYHQIHGGPLHAAQFLSRMLSDSSYKTPNFTGLTAPTKASMMDQSFGKSFLIQQIGTTGDNEPGTALGGYGATESEDIGKVLITEQWTLVNPIIKAISWGDLAYDSDDLVEYSLDVDYDYAIYDDQASLLAKGKPCYAATGLDLSRTWEGGEE